MKRILVMVVLGLTVVVQVPHAQVRPEVALRAAMELETVKGDLKAAIAAYQKIADGYPQARAVRAQALLRMADCYQKLGDAKAKDLFSQVVRDFADQPEAAAIARSRLAATRSPQSVTLATRRLYDAEEEPDSMSDDGMKAVETDWHTGNIVVRDVTSGRVHPVTAQPPGTGSNYEEWGEAGILSPDGTQVAYTWNTTIQKKTATTAGEYEGALRITKVREGDIDTPRVLQSGSSWWTPYDWSRDGKQIAALSIKADETSSIVLVSAADGHVTLLKELGSGTRPAKMLFSPDGRRLAFDTTLPEPSRQLDATDVMVMSLSDKAVHPIAAGPARERLVGWSPDGSQVIFTSERNGKIDLFEAPAAAGEQAARPTLLRSDLGPVRSLLRASSSGAFYYSKQTGGTSQIVRASLDFTTGALSGPRDLDAGALPTWSPDGSILAYVVRPGNMLRGRPRIKLRTLEYGAREVAPELTHLTAIQWGSDADTMFAIGTDGAGRAGLWRIDLRSGETTFLRESVRQLQMSGDRRRMYFFRGKGLHEFVERDIASGAERVLLAYEHTLTQESAQVTSDGSKIYYRLPDAGATAPQPASRLMERDVATGREREIFRGRLGNVCLSPDGRYVAIKEGDPEKKGVAFHLVTTGAPASARQVMRLAEAGPDALTFAAWSPDSTALLLNQGKTATSAASTWWVPLSGAAPKPLSQYVAWSIAIGRDPKSFVFVEADGQPVRFEIWVMEHFRTAPTSGSGRK